VNYLTLENVTKTYGEKVLFEKINLHINQGDKLALVAKNGTGKTTLLKLIAGEETGEGEQNKVLLHKNIRIGYLKQDPQFNPNQTVIEAVFDSDSEVVAAIMAYETAMLHPDREDALHSALARMEDLKAWDFESKIKEILFKLKITNLEQKVGSLSGGQVKRLALARLLIEEPDFLILDEPTNHLDLDMIEWLEEYLRQPKLTLFIVTHDRYFLERVCNYIVELDRGELYKYSGNYSDFLIKKTSRLDNESIETSKAQKLMRKELEWIRRAPKARGTKAKSRVDAFDKIKDKAENKLDNEKVQIEIKGARLGNKILEINYISKSYGDLNLIKDFHYKFKRNERVGIVGNNGTGKTTFLKLITKEIRPDSGTVVIGGTVKFGHYTQDGIALKEDKRVIDVITDIAEYIPLAKGQKLTARMLLERFMFSPSHQQVYVSQLSGGERRRLYLLTVLMQNPNFLILDEPTNDLDIITLNVLEEFLLQFPGCVVIVSHDRYFMDKLVDHLFIFEGEGNVRDYNGNYTEYRSLAKQEFYKKNKDQKQKLAEAASETSNTGSTRSNSSANTFDQHTENKSKPGLSFEQRKELKRIENQIKKLEIRKSEIEQKFNNTDITPEDINVLSTELGEINDTLETKETRWFELSELAE
jgi:ATP-binding cassette subfamily F protein uup